MYRSKRLLHVPVVRDVTQGISNLNMVFIKTDKPKRRILNSTKTNFLKINFANYTFISFAKKIGN